MHRKMCSRMIKSLFVQEVFDRHFGGHYFISCTCKCLNTFICLITKMVHVVRKEDRYRFFSRHSTVASNAQWKNLNPPLFFYGTKLSAFLTIQNLFHLIWTFFSLSSCDDSRFRIFANKFAILVSLYLREGFNNVGDRDFSTSSWTVFLPYFPWYLYWNV